MNAAHRLPMVVSRASGMRSIAEHLGSHSGWRGARISREIAGAEPESQRGITTAGSVPVASAAAKACPSAVTDICVWAGRSTQEIHRGPQ